MISLSSLCQYSPAYELSTLRCAFESQTRESSTSDLRFPFFIRATVSRVIGNEDVPLLAQGTEEEQMNDIFKLGKLTASYIARFYSEYTP